MDAENLEETPTFQDLCAISRTTGIPPKVLWRSYKAGKVRGVQPGGRGGAIYLAVDDVKRFLGIEGQESGS